MKLPNKYYVNVQFNDKLIIRFHEDTLADAFREADRELDSRNNVTHYRIEYPNGDSYVRELCFPGS